MTEQFRAVVARKDDRGQSLAVETWDADQLGEGEVTVRVHYSSLNYKDGLALSGKAPVLRSFPIIPGIDLAGIVERSAHADYPPGQMVLVNGWGIGERHHGGYAQLARVRADWLIGLPAGLDARQAMAIGTAGYTAMLCIMALEAHGIGPDRGPLLVTGASGGVGGIAIALLDRLGYRVTASTGRLGEADYLRGLGAREIIHRDQLTGNVRSLDKERWAGAIDAVGSTTLANVLSQICYGGAVAACGLAGGMDLPTTVAPFILRGLTLLGIDSVMAPRERRQAAWHRLARDLDLDKLERMTARTIGLGELIEAAPSILAGKVRGRILVDVAA